MRVSVDPLTKQVRTFWGFSSGDYYTDGNWSNTRDYGTGVFSGIVYINGSITSDPDPAASTGLYGMVNSNMRMTIAAENEIRITDQLVYEAPPAGPGHLPLNVLGLFSVNNNVTIVGDLAGGGPTCSPAPGNPCDQYVDAVVLAPGSGGKFWVEGWNTLSPKGSVYHLGGSVQDTFGAFGGFSPITGYGRVMTYDWRLRSNIAPPFFPLTDTYTAPRLPNPSPIAFPNGDDPLYDRPAWEEIVGL
jgi:hypothetical protein